MRNEAIEPIHMRPPQTPDDFRFLVRFFARARKTKAEIEQIFTDAESWNANSTARKAGADPVDPDPDGTLRAALAYLDGVLANEPMLLGGGQTEREQ